MNQTVVGHEKMLKVVTARSIEIFVKSTRLLRQLPVSLWLMAVVAIIPATLFSAETEPAVDHADSLAANGHSTRDFNIQTYVVEGRKLFSTNSIARLLGGHTGEKVSVDEIVQAAADLQAEYREHGFPNTTISIQLKEITNGVATMHVFVTPYAQILISGRNWFGFSSGSGLPMESLAAAKAANATAMSATNSTATATNSSTRFTVLAYEITGDTVLSEEALAAVLLKHTGTNMGIADILQAGSDLQMEYRARGFPTIQVSIPPQQITNEMVKMRVFEGRIVGVQVKNNRFFSSNNIVRALPSLKTNELLREPVFQAELDRANANRDRTIYTQITPGPVEGTSVVVLDVRDRLPLHAKVELNNQNSPGTPDLRLNTSAVYNNLWQHEHSLGVQYNFSPEAYKEGDQWAFYDKPLVANYSAFYRFPIGDPESVSKVVASQPGSFGFDEGTRRFRLPPSSGVPELNFFASRSTIDTGLMTLLDSNVFTTNTPTGSTSLDRKDVQQDQTINEDLGFRLNMPIRGTANFQSAISGGLDFKEYDLTTAKTNIFTYTAVIFNPFPIPPTTERFVQENPSAVPLNHKNLQYLPLALHYDSSLRDNLGITTFGVGVSYNPWFRSSTEITSALTNSPSTTNFTGLDSLQHVTGSRQSTGHWVTLTPSLGRDFILYTNWTLSLRADGQWASEPLVSNEQFGAGGVGSVRGYHEGEVFGDTGWHASIELKTPPQVVGVVSGKERLILRGVIFMDYAEVYLIDPQGRQPSTELWGAGFGGAASIGTHWDARMLFGWPLKDAGTTSAGDMRFNFSLSAQF